MTGKKAHRFTPKPDDPQASVWIDEGADMLS